jgi:aromatic ring-opening dioxygenase catalytic subunit (LigB family)
MFDTQSKPYKAWQKYGAAVEAAKPRGLVVVSAHWENEDSSEHVKGGSEAVPARRARGVRIHTPADPP